MNDAIPSLGGSVRRYVRDELLRNDKDFALMWVEENPDNIKLIDEKLKRDPEIMVAAGMYDSAHVDAISRRKRKLSTQPQPQTHSL